jgi:single-strand DNA-binding protein
MANLSTIQLIGRLGNDPESTYTPNGTLVVSFSLAVNRRRGDQESTNWYRIRTYGRLAENADKLTQMGAMSKGREVYVAGTFEPREFQAKDGVMKWSFDVACDNMQLIGAKESVESGVISDEVPF